MPTWQELSEVERHVLDSASEDYTQLWELEAPVTHIQQDEQGSTVRREEHEPAPRTEILRAVEHLLQLGLIQLLRRTGLDTRIPVEESAWASVLADADSWRAEGPNDVELVATDSGRNAWTS
jgi:hypothetical protein